MKYFIIFLIVFGGFMPLAFAYQIHDIDYENSSYENKKTPSLGKPVQLIYQVVNNTPKTQNYDVTVSITNLDEKKQVYFKQYQYEIQSEKAEDILWKFTPETEGLYLVEATEHPLKYTKYVFAVPKNDDFKKIHKTNITLLEDTSPRQQFRMGIDPKEILCKEGFYLALKTSNLPVCLTLETLVKLRHANFVVAEVIDYDKIGYTRSENQFKKILAEKNIEYVSDSFRLISGFSQLSLPPTTEYCGYVQDETKEDYWFSSTYHWDALTNTETYNENPMPCEPNNYSCFCSLQTLLAEENLEKLSYFDKAQESNVGKIFTDYLNEGGKITNVPNSFVIGKYNFEIPDITSFCGQFQGKLYWYFLGHIKDSKIISWGLETDKPKLCAINENTQKFTFNESAIVKDSFMGQNEN